MPSSHFAPLGSTDDSAVSGRGGAKPRPQFPFLPRLTLWGEVVTDEATEEELVAAVCRLEFHYGDEVLLRGDLGFVEWRDIQAEERAQREVETRGATDIDCVQDCLFDLDTKAHYLITLTSADESPRARRGEIHLGCSFVTCALTDLRALGFEVRVEPSYPFPTAPPETQIRSRVQVDDDGSWFSVCLGIEMDGRSYNIVPALLDLLDSAGEGTSFEALARCPTRYRALHLGDGTYVALPWERLRNVLEILAELCTTSERNVLRLPVARASELWDLDRAFAVAGGHIEYDVGEELVLRARTLSEGPRWSPEPAALRAQLRPYQHAGLMWLEHLRESNVGGVLADDMGLGKTLQTIALLAREKEARRLDCPCLIVAPTSLTSNWRKELEKFAPQLRTLDFTGPTRHRQREELVRRDVVVTSFPILIRDADFLSSLEFHYVIIDEAQAIKNANSQASVACRSLTARHKLALTGTPVENNLQELWALFEFVMPGLLGTKREFHIQFLRPIEDAADEERLERLRRRVSPFILRRLKESVATELPPKTELIRSVELEGDQRDLYESIRVAADAEVRSAIRTRGIAASAITILDALIKLRQVCCDPRLLQVDAARRAERSAKYDAFFALLEAQLAEGRRVLVFSQFARMLTLLSRGLEARGIAHFCLTGQTTNRGELVERFERGEVAVFLISLKAGGTGLNLVSADTVIHYDPWWNAAAQMQATDRAYRIGQRRPVFVYNLIATSSVEEKMLALQRRKRALAESLLANPGSLPSLVSEDLDDLFAPLGESPTKSEPDTESLSS